MKISKPGASVHSSLLDDFYFDSNYPLLKVLSYGTFTTNIIGGATINHNLGYKPFALVFSQVVYPDDSVSSGYAQHDWINLSASAFGTYYGKTNITTTQLQISVGNSEVRPARSNGFYYILAEEVDT